MEELTPDRILTGADDGVLFRLTGDVESVRHLTMVDGRKFASIKVAGVEAVVWPSILESLPDDFLELPAVCIPVEVRVRGDRYQARMILP